MNCAKNFIPHIIRQHLARRWPRAWPGLLVLRRVLPGTEHETPGILIHPQSAEGFAMHAIMLCETPLKICTTELVNPWGGAGDGGLCSGISYKEVIRHGLK